jgi:predicted secreted protein
MHGTSSAGIAYGHDARSTQRCLGNMKTTSSNNKHYCSTAIMAFFLTLLSSQQVRATEESAWAFLGFSEAGDYAAVEIFGVHEDGGSAYSMIRIIDTKANRFAVPPITTCVGQGCEDPKNPYPTTKEARTRNRLKAQEPLARFRIDVNFQGEWTKLSAKQRTSMDQGSGVGGTAQEIVQFKWLNTDLTLMLQEIPAPNGKDGGFGPPRMIDLRLQRYGAEITLQRDSSIPKSRGAGIYSYELDTVITHKNSLLVVVRHTRPGHQGPTISQMFVTAEVH